MDGFLNGQKVKTLKGRTQTQALVQGEIPFPDGVVIRKLLDCTGEVEISNVHTAEQTVKTEGKIRLDIVCEDGDGQLVSFTSWAGLEHEITAEFAQEGNEASLQAVIQNLDTHLKEDTIGLNAVVDLDLVVTSTDEVKNSDDMQRPDDTEVKSEFFTCLNTFKIGGENFRIRDELKIKDISNVVYARGYCEADKVIGNGTDAELEGHIVVHILYMDKNGEYKLTQHIIEFTQTVETKGNCEDIFARCSIEKLTARVIGEEFELVAVEALLKAEVFACMENNIALPVDAYSPKVPFECENKKMNLLLEKRCFTQTETFTETVSIREDMKEAERLLFCSAASNSANAVVTDGKIIIEGVLNLKIVYVCENGIFHTFAEDIPYRIERDAEVEEGTLSRVKVLYADAVGSGRDRTFDICFKLMFDIQLYNNESAGVIDKLCECEKKDVPHGIIIYSPGENETLFDIGKRFQISCKSLLEADENITDKIRDGKKIVLFI